MLGLGYPGGPAIQRAAERGNPRAYNLPRTFLNEPDRLAFSFSGLKTAVRYKIAPQHSAELTPPDAQTAADLAASFQQAVVDVLVGKSCDALRQTGWSTLCIGGGVAANRLLRQRFDDLAAREGIRVCIAPPELCTDNAVMGAIAIERLKAGLVESLELDAQPGLVRSRAAKS
jgi:N6-L-threonylcarbamoyladenine synthase